MSKRKDVGVAEFYKDSGWETRNGVTEDAELWEDLRDVAKEYVKRCRLRVLSQIPKKGNKILDMASGPIQYDEYLEYSKNFEKRYCVDLSPKALEAAKQKIGNHGEFFVGDFLEIPFEKNLFDCSVSMHTIYHIDKDKQEEAIRKIIDLTKPGAPVVIVYGNPDTLIHKSKKIVLALLRKEDKKTLIYGYTHPLSWWKKFEDVAQVKIYPWRSFSAQHQKILFPNNVLGSILFRILWNLEEWFPRFFAHHFQYPMIVLKKHQ